MQLLWPFSRILKITPQIYILITWGQFVFFTQNDGLPNPFDVLGLIPMVLHTTI